MNSRVKQILYNLIHTKGYMSIKKISEENEVTVRTTYTDLSEIDIFLQGNMFQKLERKTGVGIRLQEDSSSLIDMEAILEGSKSDYLEPRARQRKLMAYLLLETKYSTQETLAEIFLVSKNTIKNDLVVIKQQLGNGLRFVSYPFEGLKIKGSELTRRRYLVTLYTENDKEYMSDVNKLLDILLYKSYRTEFFSLMSVIEKEINYKLTDLSYYELLLHIAISIYQSQDNRNDIFENEEIFNSLISDNKEYEIITKINKKIYSTFNIFLPEYEILHLTVQLMSSRINSSSADALTDMWLPLQVGIYELIQAVGNELNINFMKDTILFNGLLSHLRPAYYRIKSGHTLSNPIYTQIIRDYQVIHKSLAANIDVIEEQLGITFTAEEQSFLTMFFVGAVERNKEPVTIRPKIALYCPMGASTSQMIASQIVTLYKVDVVEYLSLRDIAENKINIAIDLLITTVDLHVEGIETIKVSPILTEDDKVSLRKKLSSIDRNLDIAVILKIISNHAIIFDSKGLDKELKRYTGLKESVKRKGEDNLMLIDVLNENLIAVNQKLNNREEAVRKSGELLLENNLVDPSYIEAMLDNLEENGTYIVIAPGIAMPHARPEYGVKQIGFSLITLAEPIKFGHKTNDPVKLIFGLCATDHQSHLQALTELVELLSVEENVEKILAANSSQEVMNIIKEEV